VGDWVDHALPVCHGLDSPVPWDTAPESTWRGGPTMRKLFHLDLQVNRLTMALHEAGVLDNTVLAFVSDHGDLLYDHHHVAKALPYEGSARVPLLLRLPGEMWQAPRGSAVLGRAGRTARPVPDLLRTGRRADAGRLDGRSLLALTRGETTAGATGCTVSIPPASAPTTG